MKNTKTLLILTLIVSLAFVAGCNPKKRYSRTVVLPLKISDNQKLKLSSNVGSINISGKDIDEGTITAKITGKGDTVEKAKIVAESITIKVDTEGNNVLIVTDKPTKIKSDWYCVDFTIESPNSINIKTNVDVGNITISNIQGEIWAYSDVGSIDCKNVFGKTTLKTDVGNIALSYNKQASSQVDSVLMTDVGNISFLSPENLSAKINASTDVGSISTNLPLTVKGEICSKTVNGVIGNGEGNVKLKTDVGSISIK